MHLLGFGFTRKTAPIMQFALPLPRLPIVLFTACVLAVAPAEAASSSAKPKVSLNVVKPQEIAPGRTVTLVASATNATAYQWFNGAQAIEGATSSSYSAGSNGTYVCQVSGPGGIVRSKPVKVTVAYAPASISGYTLVANVTLTSVSHDTIEGKSTETNEDQATLRVSPDGKTITINDEDTYALTYRRTGNRVVLNARATFPRGEDEFDNENLTLTITLNGYNATDDLVTGTISVKSLTKGTYPYRDDKGRLKKGTFTETTTGSGVVAFDAPGVDL